ncbi:hypothetical protein SCA6_020343 [Theobroma cacao]
MVSFHISMTLSFYIFLCLSCLNSEAAVNFLYANCPSAGTTTYTRNSTYQRNLNFILSSLQSNSTVESGFYNLEVGQDPSDIVYGLFLCRGDVTQDICQECVNTAAGEIVLLCPDQKTALIVYDECTIRYSDRSFFSQWKMEFVLYTSNTSNVSTPDGFMALLENTTKGIAGQAANDQSGRKFATEEADFNSFPKLYTLAQCTTDLSVSSCYNCLRTAISYLPICCLGKQGGSVMLQSCNIRYELYPFYRITAEPQDEKKAKKSIWIPLGASLSATLGLALFSAGGFFIWRRRNIQEDKEISQEVQLLDLVEGRFRNEHTSEDSSGEKGAGSQKLIPSFQLHILHAATNHFSDENKLGKGGFGPVYKGTLADGKEIAVKRLSRTSHQGLLEFKNEVMSIARLQHRNLVRLLGCCLEKNEKLLAWKLWSKGQGMELLDRHLAQSCVAAEVLKCIHIGLLCVQEDPAVRPSMTSVIVILESETIRLPRPTVPAFFVGRVIAEPTQPTSNDIICSVNDVTISKLSPR